MPTRCELIGKAKEKGLKGYSKMKKAELQSFVEGGKAEEKKKTYPIKIKAKQAPLKASGSARRVKAKDTSKGIADARNKMDPLELFGQLPALARLNILNPKATGVKVAQDPILRTHAETVVQTDREKSSEKRIMNELRQQRPRLTIPKLKEMLSGVKTYGGHNALYGNRSGWKKEEYMELYAETKSKQDNQWGANKAFEAKNKAIYERANADIAAGIKGIPGRWSGAAAVHWHYQKLYKGRID